MAQKQESNLLPFLLGAGAVAAAGIAYAKFKADKEQSTDNNNWSLGGGGYSGNVGSLPVINPEYAPDSMDAGVEDIPRKTVNYGLTDPSSGGVDPHKFLTDGLDMFAQAAGDFVTNLITDPTGIGTVLDVTGVGKSIDEHGLAVGVPGFGPAALLNLGSQIPKQIANSDPVKKFMSETGERASEILDEYVINPTWLTTDAATANAVGNVPEGVSEKTGNIYKKTDTPRYTKTSPIQTRVATSLENTGSVSTTASAAETAIVNDALGGTGNVVKQTYGKSGYTYIADNGKQLTYAGATNLQDVAASIKAHNASKQPQQTSTSQTPSYRH